MFRVYKGLHIIVVLAACCFGFTAVVNFVQHQVQTSIEHNGN